MNDNNLPKVEQIVGYKFKDHENVSIAFTHSSNVSDRSMSNERLEFLGDAVLGTIICEILVDKFPEYFEGDLTKIKSMLVSRRTCAKVCRNLGLTQFLKVGKGMEDSRALSGSLAAGLLEAVIAAIYIDGGIEDARNFIHKAFGPIIKMSNAKQDHGNFKSILQQYVQKQLNTTPSYEVLDEKGPDHDKCFESGVVINGHHYPSAWGNNKKEAEQKAAFNALVELGVINEKALKE